MHPPSITVDYTPTIASGKHTIGLRRHNFKVGCTCGLAKRPEIDAPENHVPARRAQTPVFR